MLTIHDIPDELRALRLREVDATAQAINTQELEIAASNCRTFGAALQRDGRVNEAAFWSKMGHRAAEALAEIAAGAEARRERIIYNDLLKARLFDLKCAINRDDEIEGAKPDSNTNRNLRQSMTEAR